MPKPSNARLLIVDDEVALMKALCVTLRDRGYETVGFTEANAALAALRADKFDLLLTDLMMPDIDGIALLRAANEVDPDLVGIIMTGAGSVSTAVEAMKAGAFDYILKPFELSSILPVLQRALLMRELRARNAELERGLSQRNAQLIAANEALGAFAYSVSHDLRAPLRHLHGYAEAIDRDFATDLPEQARHFVHQISASSRRMQQLIDDLLRFSRLGWQDLEMQRVNVLALVNEVLAELARQNGDRPIKITVGELPDCEGDPALLRQVFLNLISNAFKFTSKRTDAAIELGSFQQGDQRVYFVRDNGAGFDMRYAERLFGVFQRLHRPDQFEGTGVGLSLVRRIVQRHGGEIWAQAELDKGATFFLTLGAAKLLGENPPANARSRLGSALQGLREGQQ